MPDNKISTAHVTRQKWIDYARGIAIILVVYRHVFEGIKNSDLPVLNYIYYEHANTLFFSFRMPLFFVVSGMFVTTSLAKRGIKRFIENKARTILYPYFVWGALQITIQIVLSNWVNSHRTVNDYLFLFYLPRELEQFWYLYALFNVAVLYAFFRVALKFNALQNVGLGILFYALCAYIGRESLNFGFITDILHYYLFYAIGDLVGRFIRDKNNLGLLESWKLPALLLIPFIFTQWYFLQRNLMHSAGHYDFVENFEPVRYVLIALTGCAFVIAVSFSLQRLRWVQWLHVLGSLSLYIYVAHVMALAGTRIFMVKVLGITYVPALLFIGIAMGLVLPVLAFRLAERLKIPWIFSLAPDAPVKKK